jgi:threonine dehydratase
LFGHPRGEAPIRLAVIARTQAHVQKVPAGARPVAERADRAGQTGAVRWVTVEDIRSAAQRIRPYVVRTPLVPALWAEPSRPLWIKPETLQPIGAFKVRGAFHAVGNLDESVRCRGVVAYSSGNHAQAVAYAARIHGIPAHIVMPEQTAPNKVEATRRHGARVVLCAAGQREQVAAELLARTGGALVPPFDHPDVIAGHGTIGLEIAEDLPTVDNVLVPVSGGGLAAGVGTAIKALCPTARVFGVEPELAADTAESLAAGHLVDWPVDRRDRTVADGLRAQPSALTFAHLQQVLDGVITVSEDEILSAVRELALHAHIVSEPSGAVGLAAYRRGTLPPGRTVVVVSGGNIEPRLLAEVLAG